jgi:hypothetical protein
MPQLVPFSFSRQFNLVFLALGLLVFVSASLCVLCLCFICYAYQYYFGLYLLGGIFFFLLFILNI